MKKLLFCLLLLSGFIAKAQLYNNEWIDHSKTYYKFKVGKTGLHRIPQSVIAAAGLGSTPAEYFQLWRNGTQVPIYTSVGSGPLSASDFIEFWGEMNDGKPDKELYRKPEYQLNDKWSLQTDTATYFLTVDPIVANNLRLREVANNVAGNTLPAEPYFMHTEGNYFKARRNNGYAVNVGETLYSSSYDMGEGWTSAEFTGTNKTELANLFVYTGAGAPDGQFKIALSGNRVNPRRYRVKINGDSVLGKQMDYYNDSRESAVVRTSLLATNKATVEVADISSVSSDRMVIHQYELTYPRQFNFGALQNFEFTLPASATGNYLEIKNFNFGGIAPVLYDLTNGKRYTGNITTPSVVKVVLEPSLSERRLVLVSQVAANSTSIAALESRQFIDYSQAINQGNYLIITNSLLIPASGSNPIDEYKQYRSSAEGGGHSVLVALIDELVDQFAFGIKKHPMSIRNFLLFARHRFSQTPKNVLLIGKGVNYIHQNAYENNANIEKLNLVPTFGWPASDVLLAADKGDSYPQIPIGRLSVINAQEVADYLQKVKEYEALQRFSSPLIKDMAWTKNVVHTVGASEESLQRILDYYMGGYRKTISDSLFGGNVNTFSKTSAETVEQIKNGGLDRLFEEGISLITYFGHSSGSTLSYNLNTPENYKNKDGKYPVFFALGCMAGDFYNFNTTRFQKKETISENFVLAPGKGSIAFIASSHFGIPHYLDIQTTRSYKAITKERYGQSIGAIMQYGVAQTFAYTTQEDFYARAQCEEMSIHGDPAIAINFHKLPDYAIEEDMVSVTPSISVADGEFEVNVKVMNIGRAVNRDILIQIKQEFPNQTSAIVFQKKILGTRYQDTLSIKIPIDPIKDKGTNKLTVIVDALNEVEEAFETNNVITKEVVIYDDEVRPVYPYNYSIVNKQNIKFYGSTANPLAATKTYQMELDTTALFNSPLKKSYTATTSGGVVEFDPQASFLDNTVYFWRLGSPQNNGEIKWNNASFTYILNGAEGFKQSHKYQHLSSSFNGIRLDSVKGTWHFDSTLNNLFVRNAIYPTAAGANNDEWALSINNGAYQIAGGCNFDAIYFNVFDPVALKPWKNTYSSTGGLYGSLPAGCGAYRDYGFEFSLKTSSSRKKAIDFLDMVPDGYIVIARGNTHSKVGENTYVDQWKGDEAVFGVGKSLYHILQSQGVPDLDSFNRPRTYIFAFKKNDQAQLQPRSVFTVGAYDKIALSLDVKVPHITGRITSPILGPAKKWKQLNWDGTSSDASDVVLVNVVGVKITGEIDTLIRNLDFSQKTVDVSTINAQQYPYLKLSMVNKDDVNLTPYRLEQWQLTYVPVPEGAIAPNVFLQFKDSVEVGEPNDFKIAFKNVSSYDFSDSMRVKMVVTDRNNVAHLLQVPKYRLLKTNDTLNVSLMIDTKKFAGKNTLHVEVNPENDQLEQHHFNNFIFKEFYVLGDSLNPIMDVTFDNTHILNGDIVAAKPRIQIKLTDEAKWMKLDDPSQVKVQVKFPDQQIREYNYNSDTLRFSGARSAPGAENMATIDFAPYFDQDGDYELIVNGEDKSFNKTGELEHRVNFKVINKPMISNMLNYPNPFTKSTAFVFTITGAEVPQNLRIQILTITGKVVKEITKEELGTLRVGRNITEYKWDGTDQYGQKLGNGVYLYRVITNLNGKSLDKYNADGDNTDQYFNNGYGKMYLMR